MATATNGTRNSEVALEVHRLSKIFGSGANTVRAVDAVDIVVRRGEILLIMGPSGSGKTTLVTMIGGLLHPTSGSVRINGLEITSMKESELPQVRRHLVGFVFQSFNLLEALNAAENVEVALNLGGRRGADAKRAADAILVRMGLSERLRFKVRDLSGGEKQRVSIARALANNPEVILADEPTANLDSKHGHEIVLLLRDIAKKENRTVIIVSHDERIREVADRVVWLEDGRFKDIGKLAHDPVCGTAIEETDTVSALYQDRSYHFCARGCRDEFLAHPQEFVGEVPSPAHTSSRLT